MAKFHLEQAYNQNLRTNIYVLLLNIYYNILLFITFSAWFTCKYFYKNEIIVETLELIYFIKNRVICKIKITRCSAE